MDEKAPICYVFGAGDGSDGVLSLRDGDFSVAADGGLLLAERLGVKPDLLLGDFDSLGYVPQGEKLKVFPPQKDETDLMLACREGLSRGYRRFRLYGALGGSRVSHTVANLQLLRWLADQDAVGTLCGRGCEVTLLRERTVRFPAGQTGFLSLFAAGERAVVTAHGVAYPLERGVLTGRYPLGVSNEFCGCDAEVTVHEGDLWLVLEPFA